MGKWLGPFIWNSFKAWADNFKDGYQFGDILSGAAGYSRNNEEGSGNSASEVLTDTLNDHNVSDDLDESGYQQVEVTPSDPTSSAANVINYDPRKTAQQNLLGYAQANNSASAYSAYLQNAYNQEMANSAISRAIADAEKNGISKYQLFQSGNAAAASPSSAASSYLSYENAMNRRESWNEKELAAIVSIVSAAITSAGKIISK